MLDRCQASGAGLPAKLWLGSARTGRLLGVTDAGNPNVDRLRITQRDRAAASDREDVAPEQSIVVHFNAAERSAMSTEAERLHDEMNGRNLAYGKSSPHRQLVGLIGEGRRAGVAP